MINSAEAEFKGREILINCLLVYQGTDFKNNKTTKREFPKEDYCFLVEQFNLDQ